MAEDHRKPAEEVAQEVLLDDPSFLKEIVERVLREPLEAEITEHVGAAPTSAPREPKGPPQRPQAEDLAHEGGHVEPADPPGSGGTFSTRLFLR